MAICSGIVTEYACPIVTCFGLVTTVTIGRKAAGYAALKPTSLEHGGGVESHVRAGPPRSC